MYGYYQELLKQYVRDILCINQTTTKNKVIAFDNKGASASINAYVTTNYPVSDSNVASIKKGVIPKGTKDKNIRLTKISISNAKNEIKAIVYKKKI